MADAGKRAQIQALALAIASGFLIPPAAVAIEAALFCAGPLQKVFWIFGSCFRRQSTID